MDAGGRHGYEGTVHNNGDGLSIRAIEKELGVSRNTIRKYLRMSECDVLVTKVDTSRRRRLDPYWPYIEYLLERFPRLSNVKLMGVMALPQI